MQVCWEPPLAALLSLDALDAAATATTAATAAIAMAQPPAASVGGGGGDADAGQPLAAALPCGNGTALLTLLPHDEALALGAV